MTTAVALGDVCVCVVCDDFEAHGGWTPSLTMASLQRAIQQLPQRHPLQQARRQHGALAQLVRKCSSNLAPILSMDGAMLRMRAPPQGSAWVKACSKQSRDRLADIFDRIYAEQTVARLERERAHLRRERKTCPAQWTPSSHIKFGPRFKQVTMLLLLALKPSVHDPAARAALPESTIGARPSALHKIDSHLLCDILSFL